MHHLNEAIWNSIRCPISSRGSICKNLIGDRLSDTVLICCYSIICRGQMTLAGWYTGIDDSSVFWSSIRTRFSGDSPVKPYTPLLPVLMLDQKIFDLMVSSHSLNENKIFCNTWRTHVNKHNVAIGTKNVSHTMVLMLCLWALYINACGMICRHYNTHESSENLNNVPSSFSFSLEITSLGERCTLILTFSKQSMQNTMNEYRTFSRKTEIPIFLRVCNSGRIMHLWLIVEIVLKWS